MIYSKDDFKLMRKASKLAMMTLDFIDEYVRAGITTEELDNLCNEFIVKNGGISACKGYSGYPKYTCISLNHVICHGIPTDKRKLHEGDILNIDVTVIVDGFFGDTSRMYKVGKIQPVAQKLIDVTYQSLWDAILAIKPFDPLNKVGDVISKTISKTGFSIVRDFCGHGVGRRFHEDPTVLHFKNKYSEEPLKPGMIFTIEPMINVGKPDTKTLSDGWTSVTKDHSLSAQFEHSIGITDKGVEVFTITDEEEKIYGKFLDKWN